MQSRSLFRLFAPALLLLLSSCGGGGSAPTSPTVVTVPLAAAMATWINGGLTANFTASGWFGNLATPITGSGRFTQAPATAGTYDGRAALLANASVSATLTIQGVTNTTRIDGIEYYSANYSPLATQSDDGFVAYPAHSYPATIQAGDGGTLYANVNLYFDNTQTTRLGTETKTYSVSADSATSLLLDFTSDEFDPRGVHTLRTQETYRIDTVGRITLVKIVQTGDGTGGSGGVTPYSVTYTFQ